MTIDRQGNKLDRRDDLLLFAFAIGVPLLTIPALFGA